MSTRGIVAVSNTLGGWTGFEVRTDAFPAWAGVEVFRHLRELGLAEFCKRTRSARLFPNMRERATQETHGNRTDISWIYLIDREQKVLRIFGLWPIPAANAPKIPGSWGEIAVHQIEDDGHCNPESIDLAIPAPWPHLPVDDAWCSGQDHAAESDRSAAIRLAVRRQVGSELAKAGLSPEAARTGIVHILGEIVSGANWQGESPKDRIYVAMPWMKGSMYFRVDIGGIELLYPSPGVARVRALQAPAMGQEIITFYAADPPRTAEIDLGHAAIKATLKKSDALLRILLASLPTAGWFFALCDLHRATQVQDPRGEVFERLGQSAETASDWLVFDHPDGRVWSVRASTKGYQLRLGKPDEEPVFKERAGSTADLTRIIDEQRAEGFVPR